MPLQLSYGVTESLSSFKKVNHDNFYRYKKENLKNQRGLIYNIYLLLNKQAYDKYKFFFPNETKESLIKKTKFTRWFGDANLIMLIVLYILLHSNIIKKYLKTLIK